MAEHFYIPRVDDLFCVFGDYFLVSKYAEQIYLFLTLKKEVKKEMEIKNVGLAVVGVGFAMMVGFGLAGKRAIAGFGFSVMCLGGAISEWGG